MRRIACAAILLCFATVIAANAQTLTTLTSLKLGFGDFSSLVQGIDGNFYGTSTLGGVNNIYCSGSGCGTVFKVTPSGTLTLLAAFCGVAQCPHGYFPSSVMVGGDGNFYGTTYGGGPNSSTTNCQHGCGTIFRLTPNGQLTTLYDFCSQANCADGYKPNSLMQGFIGGVYGDFFGATSTTIFRLTPEGQFMTLSGIPTEIGTNGRLVQTVGGNFYGVTSDSSNNGACKDAAGRCGNIFRMTPSGIATPVHLFTEPTEPNSTLVQGSDGFFYGTTQLGGNVFLNPPQDCPDGCGTVFKMSSSGSVTTLYKFCSLPNCGDGRSPFNSGLIQATDGNFYGTTPNTIFKITPSGSLTTLYTFCGPPNCGSNAYFTLVQGTDGKFYGITQNGGANNQGTIFSLDVGLPPFLTPTGNVGNSVGILGQGFTGTTAVSFNGTAATFTVKSDTFLTAVIPSGATTGSVAVTTPSGILTSNVAYRVTN
jgi:uncharacterized repeat protein (TIGR03803 family)